MRLICIGARIRDCNIVLLWVWACRTATAHGSIENSVRLVALTQFTWAIYTAFSHCTRAHASGHTLVQSHSNLCNRRNEQNALRMRCVVSPPYARCSTTIGRPSEIFNCAMDSLPCRMDAIEMLPQHWFQLRLALFKNWANARAACVSLASSVHMCSWCAALRQQKVKTNRCERS